MHLVSKWLVLLLALLALGCVPPRRCTPASCTGCCAEDDTCQGGAEPSACGQGGASCDVCVAPQACGSDGRCGAPMVDAGPPPPELRASRRAFYGWDGDGGAAPVVPLADAVVGAYVRSGGGSAFVPGLAFADGTFRIAGLAPGEVTVQLGPDVFVVTEARTVNVDRIVGGRLDALRASIPTVGQLDVRGLVPVDGGVHRLRLFFSQDLGPLALEARASPALTPDATTFTASLDWATLDPERHGLPDARHGDQGWVVHQHDSLPDAGALERRTVAAGALLPLVLVPGTTPVISVTLSPTVDETTPLDIDRAAYRALSASFGRDRVTSEFIVSFVASPAPTTAALTPLPLYTLRQSEALPLPTSVTWGTVPGTPWGSLLELQYQQGQNRRASPAGRLLRFVCGTRVVDSLAAQRGRRWAPVLSAIRNPAITGRSLAFDVSGVGQSPTITWEPPTIGTPTGYRVTFYAITDTGADTGRRFYTTKPTLAVPQGLLSTTETYVLEFVAFSYGSGTLVPTVPFAESSYISGLVRP